MTTPLCPVRVQAPRARPATIGQPCCRQHSARRVFARAEADDDEAAFEARLAALKKRPGLSPSQESESRSGAPHLLFVRNFLPGGSPVLHEPDRMLLKRAQALPPMRAARLQLRTLKVDK